jgi:hypothetical protein
MAGHFVRMLSIFAAVLALSGAPAMADESPAATPDVRALIERQLDAFAKDDAAAAYALAAPSLKTKFSDADGFLAMVRSAYAPVYRHRSAEFGAMAADGDDIAQTVTLIDGDNKVWVAIYKLTRQADGSWLISGCMLIQSRDSAT